MTLQFKLAKDRHTEIIKIFTIFKYNIDKKKSYLLHFQTFISLYPRCDIFKITWRRLAEITVHPSML